MLKNSTRGRPKTIKAEDLAKALEKKNKVTSRTKILCMRLSSRISSRANIKRDISNIDLKYIIKGRMQQMISYSKYKLPVNDPLLMQLKKQCNRPPSIGILALTELEVLDGLLPSGGAIEDKLLKGFEYTPASYIYANRDYCDKILENYYQADITSAYPYMLKKYKMPTTLNRVEKGIVFDKEKICVYINTNGNASFNPIEVMAMGRITDTCIYNAEYVGHNFIEKWFNLKNEPRYCKLAKDMLNCAIGAIHRYRKNLISRYVWWLQKSRMQSLREEVEKAGGTVVKIHTDSIGWLNTIEKPFEYKKGVLGELHEEHTNKRVIIIGAGQYQIEGNMPVLSGISWGGTFIETEEGKIHGRIFPCIRAGMKIKSYEKDGEEFKELGKEVVFLKGGNNG